MKMRMYNPELAAILQTMDKEPLKPTFLKFADIVKAMRVTHEFLSMTNEKFKALYQKEEKGGKLTRKGLEDLKADFQDTSTPFANKMKSMYKDAIEAWKEREQRNTYVIVNKAPTDEQARSLEVILKKDNVSQGEIEMWAKHLGDNYLCSTVLRDFAAKKGYTVTFSDFTLVEDRITAINDAVKYLHDMLEGIDKPTADKYKYLAFYGTDETGESYKGSPARDYAEVLDSDPTFKPQTITIKPKEEQT